jgi:hypothetical protein
MIKDGDGEMGDRNERMVFIAIIRGVGDQTS